MYKPEIKIFYRKEMVPSDIDMTMNSSKSPLKPQLILSRIITQGLWEGNFKVTNDWEPFSREDFLMAHTPSYVDDFFGGVEPVCSSNFLKWTPLFADSVRYTNASLYNAIKTSVEDSSQICFSPTSGFHHATPKRGAGFCTFSGQVIASRKLYLDKGYVGCYIDLDNHFGNSIEDSREMFPDLDEAVPPEFNVNPEGSNHNYILDLEAQLIEIEEHLLAGNINYIVICSGADSHDQDDSVGRVNTEEWITAKVMVYSMIKRVNKKLNKLLPVTISLFGGYRRDDYNSVLDLHVADLVACHNILNSKDIKFDLKVSMSESKKKFLFEEKRARYAELLSKEDKDLTDDDIDEMYELSKDRDIQNFLSRNL